MAKLGKKGEKCKKKEHIHVLNQELRDYGCDQTTAFKNLIKKIILKVHKDRKERHQTCEGMFCFVGKKCVTKVYGKPLSQFFEKKVGYDEILLPTGKSSWVCYLKGQFKIRSFCDCD